MSLGLLDALARQPCTVRSLAGRTGCDGEAVHRLPRALAGIDVVEHRASGHWALTPTGQLLQADVPGSVRD